MSDSIIAALERIEERLATINHRLDVLVAGLAEVLVDEQEPDAMPVSLDGTVVNAERDQTQPL